MSDRRPSSLDKRHTRTSEDAKDIAVWQPRNGFSYHTCETPGCTAPMFVSRFVQHIYCRDHFIEHLKNGVIVRPTRLCQVCEQGPIVHKTLRNAWLDTTLAASLFVSNKEAPEPINKRKGAGIQTFYICDYDKCKYIYDEAVEQILTDIKAGLFKQLCYPRNISATTRAFMNYIDKGRRALGWTPPPYAPGLIIAQHEMTYADKMDLLKRYHEHYLSLGSTVKPSFSADVSHYGTSQTVISNIWKDAQSQDCENRLIAWDWINAADRKETEIRAAEKDHARWAQQFGIPTRSAGLMLRTALQRIEDNKR